MSQSSRRFFIIPIVFGAVAVLTIGMRPVTQQAAAPTSAISTVRDFLDAFERADIASIAATFSDDATMFAPFVATRLDGRDAILAALAPIFERLRARGEGPRYLTLDPVDIHTRKVGGAAIVTWHFRRPDEVGRRTAVLEPINDGWKIVSFHASTFPLRNGEQSIEAQPASHRAQQQTALPRLDEYDWTRWLVGEWEGWFEDPAGNRTRQHQSFEFVADQRHILTKLILGEEDEAYYGVGVFSYDPVRGQASGEWFGMFGDRNNGLARRDGDRMVWDIHRHGRQRVHRVRERLSDDEYIVTNATVDDQGRQRLTHERMRRVARSTGA